MKMNEFQLGLFLKIWEFVSGPPRMCDVMIKPCDMEMSHLKEFDP